MQINKIWVAGLACFGISFLIGLGTLVYWKTNTEMRYWPIGVDVYPHWVATRAFWQGDGPYTTRVMQETQQLIYARPLEPGDDPFGFYYPAYVVFLISPLSALPIEWAGLVWSAFNWAMLVTLGLAYPPTVTTYPVGPSFAFRTFLPSNIFDDAQWTVWDLGGCMYTWSVVVDP